jgi:hypothetical protein
VVEVTETADLGDRGDVARDGDRAVVGPQRDLERAEEVFGAQRLDVALVAQTRIHNGYVGRDLTPSVSPLRILPHSTTALDICSFRGKGSASA